MSEVFRCEDKETLVAYLYGEVDGDVRREVERHLRTCGACTRELDGLHHVRDDLQLWMPPTADLGFSIVQHSAARPPQATVLTSSRWASLHALPAWAQVAAAALFIAAAAAIANVQVRSTQDGMVVTTGWMPAADPAPAVTVSSPTTDDVRVQLAAVEQSLREELRGELRAELNAQQQGIREALSAAPAADQVSTGAVIRRVQSMIDASEERQRQEMALRFAQAERMWNVRWTNDRATLNRQLGSLQGQTMAVQVGQQELKNQIRLQRVSAPQPNQ